MRMRKHADQPRRPRKQYTPPSPIGPLKSRPCEIDTCPRCGEEKTKKSRLCRRCKTGSNRPPIDPKVYRIEGIRCRKIPVNDGFYAIVYAIHYAWLMQWNWFATKGDIVNKRGYTRYAMTGASGGRVLFMHRMILGMGSKKVDKRDVAHLNENGLDNRESNLLPITHKQHMQSHGRKSTNKSGYVGVIWYEPSKKWRAYIQGGNGKVKHIGYFKRKKEAAIARDVVAIGLWGPMAYLNFPSALGSR